MTIKGKCAIPFPNNKCILSGNDGISTESYIMLLTGHSLFIDVQDHGSKQNIFRNKIRVL